MTKILGNIIYDKTKSQLLEYIINLNEKIHLVSGNPEILYTSLNNFELAQNIKRTDSLIFPDGAGVVLASKLLNSPVKEKIAGIELMGDIIEYCNTSGKSIYLLGTKDEMLKECITNLSIKYPKLNICGSHNGFFDINNCKEILDDINQNSPYALFVAMGCPRQELFISKYMSNLNSKIFMGVGGAFDVLAGRVKRAPRWMIKLNLEWLYRVSKEPFRIKRLSSIPKFLFKAVLHRT
jgi:N-acetylglucosaminyldiphosphoundecaprenol N-acetyl-beta-D-mannosaminyltransferase